MTTTLAFTNASMAQPQFFAATEKNSSLNPTSDFFKKIGMNLHFQSGQNIFIQNTPSHGVYYIENGLVQISHLMENGNETIIKIVKENELILPSHIFKPQRYQSTATAITDLNVIFIHRDSLKYALKNNQEVKDYLLQLVVNDNEYLERKLLEKIHGKAIQRLAKLFVEFFRLQDTDNKKSMAFKMLLTRRQIASMIGVAPETSTRLINQLKESNIIDEREGLFLIRDLVKLKNVAEI